jgi:hypothetical protein
VGFGGLQHTQTVQPRHLKIGDDQLKRLCANERDSFFAVGSGLHAVAQTPQVIRE